LGLVYVTIRFHLRFPHSYGQSLVRVRSRAWITVFHYYFLDLAASALMSTLTVHSRWDCQPPRERTDHLPSCAEIKEMKSPLRHTRGCAFGRRTPVKVLSFGTASDRPFIRNVVVQFSMWLQEFLNNNSRLTHATCVLQVDIAAL